MAAGQRRDLDELATVLLYSDSSESSDDDIETAAVLLETIFPPVDRPYRTRVCIDDLDEVQCERLFRFGKGDLHRLCLSLGLPDTYRYSQGTKATGMEALLILLRRLSYPNRLYDLCPLFGRTEPELSIIFNMVLDDVYDKFKDRLTNIDHVWLNMPRFSEAVHAKGAALQNCWGFIDGTVRPIARPIRNQRVMFSGHKRVHCIKFQSVVAPNGLIVNLFGPVEGRRHDAFMLAESGLAQQLTQFNQPNGQPYILYGDPAYGISRNILGPYKGAQVTQQQEDFNKSMSRVRVCVEWVFGKLCQYFTFVDFKRSNRVLLLPVGKHYTVAALLTNCHTCLYGSVTSSFFNVHPPSLEQYLSNV